MGDFFADSDAESDSDGDREKEAASSLPVDLPSAASLLAGPAAAEKWLKKPAWALKPRTQRQPAPTKRPLAEDDDHQPERGHDMYEFYDAKTGWQNKQDTTFQDDDAGYGGTSRAKPTPRSPDPPEHKAPPRAEAPEKKKAKRAADKAKDRVKQQRLAGQSGIGADFRVWRSEEEMRMRQQFDS